MRTRILLADDHRITREGLRPLLVQEPDFEIVCDTGDGREAVDLATRLSPDVAILDVSMPSLNGIEAARQIHEQNPQTKVIVLSMHAERQFVTESMSAGAAGYLLKDCDSSEISKDGP